MTATNHDNQRHNLVKFIQQCQMSLTTVKRLYTWQEIAHLGRPAVTEDCAASLVIMVCGRHGIPCGHHGQVLWPSWFVGVMV